MELIIIIRNCDDYGLYNIEGVICPLEAAQKEYNICRYFRITNDFSPTSRPQTLELHDLG